MSSNTNMGRAKLQERGFWFVCVPTLVLLCLSIFEVLPLESKVGNSRSFLVFVFVCVSLMGGIAQRTFLALKQEIADLKSGDADESTAAQDSE